MELAKTLEREGPSQGLRNNLLRLYNTINEDRFAACHLGERYCRLLFALTFFHAVLMERRKFRSLGYNILYDFDDTDYKARQPALICYL